MQSARLIRRYKRFLADVELPEGRVLTVHCPNSGSMLGCLLPGSPVRISQSDNVRRKYAYTLEMIMVNDVWVGINTSLTNHLVHEALDLGIISEIGVVDTIRPEVKVSDKSRLDFLLTKNGKKIYVEVKNCTLAENGTAMFPDAVTVRGTKHLRELLALRESGSEACVLFCVQRMDAKRFSPASHIDPLYAETLAAVKEQGVQVLAYQADVSPEQIKVVGSLPVML